MRTVRFELTPPKRPGPKPGVLDHSTTFPYRRRKFSQYPESQYSDIKTQCPAERTGGSSPVLDLPLKLILSIVDAETIPTTISGWKQIQYELLGDYWRRCPPPIVWIIS